MTTTTRPSRVTRGVRGDEPLRRPRRRGRRPRPAGPSWWLLTGLIGLAIAGVAGLGARIYGGDDPFPDGDDTVVAEGVGEAFIDPGIALEAGIRDRLDGPGRPIPATELAAVLEGGVERLLAHPGVEVSTVIEGLDAATAYGRALVGPASGELDLREEHRLEAETIFTVERRVVDSSLFVRTYTSADDETLVLWDAIPLTALGTSDFDLVLVAGGRAAASLQGLTDLAWWVADLPVSAAETVTDDHTAGEHATEHVQALILDRASRTYRLIVPTDLAIDHALREAADPDHDVHAPQGGLPSVFEFTIAPDGALERLDAYGTILQDTEALGPVFIQIRYRAAEEPVISAPVDDAVRR